MILTSTWMQSEEELAEKYRMQWRRRSGMAVCEQAEWTNGHEDVV